MSGFVSTDERLEEAILDLIASFNPLRSWKTGRDFYDVKVAALAWAYQRVPEVVVTLVAGTLVPVPQPLGWTPWTGQHERPTAERALDTALQCVRVSGVPLRGAAKFNVRQATIERLLAELPPVVERLVGERIGHKLTSEQRRRLVGGKT